MSITIIPLQIEHTHTLQKIMMLYSMQEKLGNNGIQNNGADSEEMRVVSGLS